MKITNKIALATSMLALGATPAIAMSSHAPVNSAAAHKHSHAATLGPRSSASAKARAYGKFCKSESKKHVAGQHGTPFSKCVTAMAKVATEQASSPHGACKGLSKKHVAGQRGTPFSQCVSGAAKLRHQHPPVVDTDDTDTDTTGTTGTDTTGTTVPTETVPTETVPTETVPTETVVTAAP